MKMVIIMTAVKMTDEQQKVFDAAMEGESFFLTGNAGTGKSFVLKQIIKAFKAQHQQFYVTASTGIAAVNVHGSTLHSLLMISPSTDLTGSLDNKHKRIAEKMFTANSGTLIIDEISMCGVDLFSYMMKMIEYAEDRNHFRMQLIFVGDFSQLPPVYSTYKRRGQKESEYDIIEGIYGGVFAFQSSEWTESRFKTFVLSKIIRQDNPDFMNALNEIRVGDPQGLEYINTHSAKEPQHGAITLTGTNATANSINSKQIAKLPGVSFVFHGDASDKFSKSAQPTESELTLKLGARVMIVANTVDAYNGEMGTVTEIDVNGEEYYLNPDENRIETTPQYALLHRKTLKAMDRAGTRDQAHKIRLKAKLAADLLAVRQVKHDNQTKVINLTSNDKIAIVVESDEDGSEKVFGWHEWNMYHYVKHGGTVEKKSGGKFIQVPLRLGYAITVHKSQGQTYNACNFLPQIFADGQLYVALSRVTDISRLYLSKPLTVGMVRTSGEVIDFYRKLLSQEGITSLGIYELPKKPAPVASKLDQPVATSTLEVKAGRMMMLNWLNDLPDDQYEVARNLLRSALLLKP